MLCTLLSDTRSHLDSQRMDFRFIQMIGMLTMSRNGQFLALISSLQTVDNNAVATAKWHSVILEAPASLTIV